MNLSIKEELGVDLVMLVAGGPGVLYELAVGKPLDQFTILCWGELLDCNDRYVVGMALC